jgi:hypothetical protein
MMGSLIMVEMKPRMDADQCRLSLLELVDNSFDFSFWRTEIQEKANRFASCFEVIEALSGRNLVEALDCFDSNQNLIVKAEV